MSQRMIAAVVAGPLCLVLLLLAALAPLPYVTYSPGGTFDVLSDTDGREIIQVDGEKAYRDGGELLMTTVVVTPPETDVSLGELMYRWIDPDSAVMPYDSVYQKGVTQEENDAEGAAQMASSQDLATAAALTELGYDVTTVEVQGVESGSPADGRLEVGDVILSVNGQTATSTSRAVDAVRSTEPGRAAVFQVRRGAGEREVSVVPANDDEGVPRVGVSLGAGVDVDAFPFEVSVNINPNISGPSAGLMFSLAIYDTLTPGSLTGGGIVAGTGEISADGAVAPIGGIDQKIAGARDDGAELFLVPPANCDDVTEAPNGDMRLVLAQTMHDARLALDTWVDDHDADLPSCDDLQEQGAMP